MHQDIISQIERAKELLNDLEISCEKDFSAKSVSEKTKNLTQEVLLKMKHVLDQALNRFFGKHISPKLSAKEKKEARVFFPAVNKKEDLKSVLGRAKMGSLLTDYPDLFNYLDSIQPYNNDFLWLRYLTDFAGEKHLRLTPQTKTETKRMTASTENISVSILIDNPNFSVKQGEKCKVTIGGVPIRFANQGIIPLAPGLDTTITKWVAFQFEGTKINSLWLCKDAVNKGEKIIEQLFSFI